MGWYTEYYQGLDITTILKLNDGDVLQSDLSHILVVILM